ncbi:hypothetical protein FJ651_14135 [Paucihalobacter ruber]|uniref:Uncharacterized protein n=1 Tax=Paucihalobacter ruber TaxID=2567861 RepID=A0A506PEM6_9FLAO|nr:hypothetical protein [Paucihalobacter ruber]TPV31948.1 hypothetical protein FJ651_14135 [Paucihalobacter ruber]
MLVLPICRSEQTGISGANPKDKIFKSIAFVSGIKLKNHSTQPYWVLVLPICRGYVKGIHVTNTTRDLDFKENNNLNDFFDILIGF